MLTGNLRADRRRGNLDMLSHGQSSDAVGMLRPRHPTSLIASGVLTRISHRAS
jgi:hypothetical protein